MAIKYSSKLREFLAGYGSMKRALEGGVIEIFTGAAPTNPDDAETGSTLVSISLASGTVIPEILSAGTVEITVDGTVTGITVNSGNAIQIMSGTVTAQGTLTLTAAAVVANINRFISTPNYSATSAAGVITITALPMTGAGPNGDVVTAAGGATFAAEENMGTAVAGVAAVNGLTYDDFPLGVLDHTGVFSGTVLATGTAGYFRIKGSVIDAGGADTSPYEFIRIQGTCGTSGADYNMDSTSLTYNATHTIDDWDITIPAA